MEGAQMAENDSSSADKGTEAQSGDNPSLDSGDSSKSGSSSSSSSSSSSGKGQTTTRAKGRRSGQSDEQQEQEAAQNRFTSLDTLTDIKAAQGPLQPTAIDASGIERIVGPAVDDNWTPAPVDPDPEAMEHHARVQEAEAERREQRLGATQIAPSDHLREAAKVTRKATGADKRKDS
jgi:hypothetical protein